MNRLKKGVTRTETASKSDGVAPVGAGVASGGVKDEDIVVKATLPATEWFLVRLLHQERKRGGRGDDKKKKKLPERTP